MRLSIPLLLLVFLSACSRTVQWEEEVPLNTGEVIWVKREVTYKFKGAGGNPFDMGYRPDRAEQLTFDWKGVRYRYDGDASLMLLAISPDTKRPVLVASAANRDWHWRHKYRCTTPFYVQFVPSASGREWSWPPGIEPWLFNMPHNLMAHRAEVGRMKARYTSSDRVHMDMTMSIQDPPSARIDPAYKFDECRK